jgi:hypothetical protein
MTWSRTDVGLRWAVGQQTSYSSSSYLPLKCWASGCEAPISFLDLQKHLKAEKFTRLLTSAPNLRIRQHPELYRACAYPYCLCVYAPNTGPLSTCPLCLCQSCPHCAGRPHPNMSCTEYDRLRHSEPNREAEPAQEVIRQIPDFQQCPQRGAMTDFEYGYAHMKYICGAHRRWICAKQFSKGEICQHVGRCMRSLG